MGIMGGIRDLEDMDLEFPTVTLSTHQKKAAQLEIIQMIGTVWENYGIHQKAPSLLIKVSYLEQTRV